MSGKNTRVIGLKKELTKVLNQIMQKEQELRRMEQSGEYDHQEYYDLRNRLHTLKVKAKLLDIEIKDYLD